MPTYQQASDEVCSTVHKVMKQHHPELIEIGVRVKTLMAHATRDEHTGDPKGSAIKHHGIAALGLIKITSLKDRVAGLDDAVMLLGGDRWDGLSSGQRAALIDHELTHLVPALDKEGTQRIDDANRPVLKIKEHDYELTGFWSVVERHREEAIESSAFSDVSRGFTQREFPWGLT